jgi:tRNA modification GTPase
LLNSIFKSDTICAIATAPGLGAIAVIRLSGPESISICNKIFFYQKGVKDLNKVKSHTLHFGALKDQDRIIDEVLLSIFKGPHSYTGEDTVEISCHGSPYIQQEILKLLIHNGASQAGPGEFTMRAYLNGKLDLSQAEAVADLIASDSEASHQIAMHQMRGGFSLEINSLREQLIHFASLIELELDFAEEDVEFANRKDLIDLISKIKTVIKRLVDSFAVGNVLKNGIPVAIVGEPNVGKSTLLNALLNEDRAIVSEIAGTTRDTIEDEITIKGINYRFIDTAGIRETKDTIEALGINKTFEKIDQASVVLYLFDAITDSPEKIKEVSSKIQSQIAGKNKLLLLLANKIDKANFTAIQKELTEFDNLLFISAKNQENIEQLKEKLSEYIHSGTLRGNHTIVSNLRHYEALTNTFDALDRALMGINSGITSDLIAMDIRRALYYLGLITGSISVDDLLGNIFSKFCIGK